MKRTFILLLIIACSMLYLPSTFGKGGSSRSSSSFSSRSSSSSSFRSWGSRPSSSSWGTSRPQKSTSSSFNSSRNSAKSVAVSRAAERGTLFKSKSQAQSAFKQKFGSQYKQTPKPNTPEPAKRPDYIPKQTTVGGKTVNVTYNQNVGGYGYWSGGGPGLGAFLLYDAMSDAVMMNTLMHRHNYVVGAPPGTHSVLALKIVAWLVSLIIITISFFVIFSFMRGN